MVTVRKAEDVKEGALLRVAKDADEATKRAVHDSIPAMVVQLPQNEAAAFKGDINVAVVDVWEAVDECIEASRYADKDALAAFCQEVMEEVGA